MGGSKEKQDYMWLGLQKSTAWMQKSLIFALS